MGSHVRKFIEGIEPPTKPLNGLDTFSGLENMKAHGANLGSSPNQKAAYKCKCFTINRNKNILLNYLSLISLISKLAKQLASLVTFNLIVVIVYPPKMTTNNLTSIVCVRENAKK